MNVAEEIRAEMARQHLTFVELSNRTGISQWKLSRVISKESQPLEIPDATMIAEALNLRFSDLIIRAEENAQGAAA